MARKIELSECVVKNLKQLDHQHAQRILSLLYGYVAQFGGSRRIGEALKGFKLRSLVSNRVGATE